MDKKLLKTILGRLDKLEHVVFASKSLISRTNYERRINNYKGATGGIRLLITELLFNNKRLFSDIRSQLGQKGYHYSREAVQGGLKNL